MPEESVKLYAEMLADLPVEVLKLAVLRLIETRPYTTWPSIGELRRAAAQVLLNAPSPAEAVEEVREQIRAVGHWGSPRFSHPLVKRAVDAADWYHLCMSEEPTVSMAQFRRLYEDVLETWTARVQTHGLAALERLGLRALPEPERAALPGGGPA